MHQAEAQIQRIQEKIQLLVKERQQLKKKCAVLEKENAGLKAELEEKIEALKKKQEQADILKMSNPGMDEGEKKQLQARINMYLAEIDKCIALLNE